LNYTRIEQIFSLRRDTISTAHIYYHKTRGLSRHFAKKYWKKAKILQNIQKEQWFNDIKQAFIRIQKILKNKNVTTKIVETSLFDCEDEKNLYNEYIAVLTDYSQYFNQSNFENALNLLQKLSNLINTFFDNNLVLSQNEAVCQNRINMLSQILKLYTNIFNII